MVKAATGLLAAVVEAAVLHGYWDLPSTTLAPSESTSASPDDDSGDIRKLHASDSYWWDPPSTTTLSFGGSIDSGDVLTLRKVQHGGWYVADVAIGGATVRLAVDTGSSTIWHRPLSQPQNLSESVATVAFNARYGRGSVSGTTYTAEVTWGHHSSICSIGRADQESDFWAKQQDIDGLLGLGCGDAHWSLQGGTADALSCALPEQGNKRTFTLTIDDTGGSIIFGDMPVQYQGDLVFMPPSQGCGHWSVPLVSMNIGSGASFLQTSGDFLEGQGGTAILDTGSDGIVGPTFDMIKLARKFNANEGNTVEGTGAQVNFYTVPCDSVASMPDLTLTLGTSGADAAKVTIPARSLVGARSDEGGSNCHLRVAGWETDSWILGRVFLTQLKATVFDASNSRVALAI